MKAYVAKLFASRATFMQDATPEEIAVMKRHLAYWSEHMAQKRVAVFGPVADPKGPYGIAILTLADDVDPATLTTKDPAILELPGFRYEVAPMVRAVLPS